MYVTGVAKIASSIPREGAMKLRIVVGPTLSGDWCHRVVNIKYQTSIIYNITYTYLTILSTVFSSFWHTTKEEK